MRTFSRKEVELVEDDEEEAYTGTQTKRCPIILYFCNNQDAGLVNLAYVVDDERGERDSNRLLPFPQISSLTEMITRVSVAGLLTAGMIAAARYRHFICFFLPPTLYNVEFL